MVYEQIIKGISKTSEVGYVIHLKKTCVSFSPQFFWN